MEAYLTINDKKMFYKYLDKANIYFEYGSGGSTYQASIRKNISQIYSVESDKEWYTKLKKILNNTDNRIQYIYNEMDVQRNNWGRPGPKSTISQRINYSNQITTLSIKEQNNIDLVMIDGRFRVACCLKCFNVISDTCLIIFDDFLTRPEYHVVLDYYDIIEKTNDNRMVILQKKKNVLSIPVKIIHKYELIMR